MDVQDLIARCARDRKDTEAWAELCRLVEDVALDPIRRMVSSRKVGAIRAEDVLQEFFVFLAERNMHPLPTFRGASKPQLRCFLRTLALRFASRTLQRWQRKALLESSALVEWSRREREPLEENQLRALWEELQRLATAEDRAKLRIISDAASSNSTSSNAKAESRTVALRTVRHWRHELYQKYADRIL